MILNKVFKKFDKKNISIDLINIVLNVFQNKKKYILFKLR